MRWTASAHQDRKGDADGERHGQPDEQDFVGGARQTEHRCDSRFPTHARKTGRARYGHGDGALYAQYSLTLPWMSR